MFPVCLPPDIVALVEEYNSCHECERCHKIVSKAILCLWCWNEEKQPQLIEFDVTDGIELRYQEANGWRIKFLSENDNEIHQNVLALNARKQKDSPIVNMKVSLFELCHIQLCRNDDNIIDYKIMGPKKLLDKCNVIFTLPFVTLV